MQTNEKLTAKHYAIIGLLGAVFVYSAIGYIKETHAENIEYCKEQTQRSYNDCMVMMGE